MYYFQPEEDKDMSKPKGNIKLFECHEVIVKDMSKSKEIGYTFKVNIGERLYHLMADTEIERQQWISAVKASQVTAREMTNPLNIKVLKNIDPIVVLYDSTRNIDGRRDKIRSKIDEDFEKIRNKALAGIDYLLNLEALIKFLDPLQQDLLQVLNCCLVKEPKRVDLIREYIDYLHEKICDILTIFWDKHHNRIQSIGLLQLAKWIYNYGDLMKDFCNDDRLTHGVKILLNIYINRSIDSIESVVAQILEYEAQNEPFLNENDQLVTQAPVDLFKILNEGYDLAYTQCRVKETIYKLAYFGKVVIKQYQEGIDELLESEAVNLEKLIALCNNTIQLNNFSKQYNNRIMNEGGLTEEEVEKVFDLSKIQKKFVQLSTTAKDMFFFHFFGQVGKKFKGFYLEHNLEAIMKEIIDPAQDAVSKMHDSFSRKIWKSLIDITLFYYFNSFIVGCNKAKKDDLNKFLKKLKDDREIFASEFDGIVFENILNQGLKPFEDFTEFYQGETLDVLEPCKNLRVYFGKPFSAKTIKTLMQLRSNLDKNRKEDIVEACAQLIADYNKNNKDTQSEIEKLKLGDQLGVDDEEEEQDLEQMRQDEADQASRRKDIQLDDFDAVPGEEFQVTESSRTEEQKTEFIDEGFLYRKKPKEKDFFNMLMVNPMKQMVKHIEKSGINVLDLSNSMEWEQRYFRIRKGFIYWYSNERARESNGKMDISKIEDIIGHPMKTLMFKLVMEGGKKLKFRTETKEVRDLWVKSLTKEVNQLLHQSEQKIEAIKTGEGKKPIISDYDEINRRQKQKEKMEQKKQKLKERQEEQMKKKDERQKNASFELKKQSSLMPNLKENQGFDLGDPSKRASTIFEISSTPFQFQQSSKKSCCDKLLICMGVKQAY